MSNTECQSCSHQLERVRYFPRQLLTADEMRTEQEYIREKLRRHNRYLHGWGVVCGLQVEALPTAEIPWQVRVCPGYAVAPQGDDILVEDCIEVDLKHVECPPCQPAPCPPQETVSTHDVPRNRVWLAVRYAECFNRPVRVHPGDCGCDENQCEYSRIRDGFKLKVLTELPESHINPHSSIQSWVDLIRQTGDQGRLGIPMPPCPQCIEDPWVVIACIRLPDNPNTAIRPFDISTENNVLLWSVRALATSMNLP